MLKFLALAFSLSGLLFVLSIFIHKIYISKQKDIMKASHFIASMTIFMGLYILSGFILTFFVKGIFSKILIFLFAMSPFIVGKFATYKYEKIYSLIQVFCVLISIGFIFYKVL
ncbi:MAG: hypothetical protein IJ877_08415 [Candidatus Gastranaerophilales bacterium]|nr:hypothetical protein [Candidatus Gastranaerophilales bacterium]